MEQMELTEEQLMIREMASKFADSEVRPIAKEIDAKGEYPLEMFQKMAEVGFLGLSVPAEYGGAGVDTVCYSIVVEELSRVCASTGLSVAAHNSLGCFPILAFGSEEQKKKYLPRAAQGELIAFGLTEPDAGSDAGGTRTMAVKNSDGWMLNGSKCWITSAPQAMASICTAKT